MQNVQICHVTQDGVGAANEFLEKIRPSGNLVASVGVKLGEKWAQTQTVSISSAADLTSILKLRDKNTTVRDLVPKDIHYVSVWSPTTGEPISDVRTVLQAHGAHIIQHSFSKRPRGECPAHHLIRTDSFIDQSIECIFPGDTNAFELESEINRCLDYPLEQMAKIVSGSTAPMADSFFQHAAWTPPSSANPVTDVPATSETAILLGRHDFAGSHPSGLSPSMGFGMHWNGAWYESAMINSIPNRQTQTNILNDIGQHLLPVRAPDSLFRLTHKAMDRQGILADTTNMMAGAGIDIAFLAASVVTFGGRRRFHSYIFFEHPGVQSLAALSGRLASLGKNEQRSPIEVVHRQHPLRLPVMGLAAFAADTN